MVTWDVFSLVMRAVRLGNRRCIQCNVSIRSRQQLRGCVERQVSCLPFHLVPFIPFRPIRLHSIQFHCTTLHYPTSSTLHCIPLRSDRFHYVLSISIRPLYFIPFQYVPLHSVPLHSIAFRFLSLFCVHSMALQYIPLHFTTFRYVLYIPVIPGTFHYVPLHSLAFHYIPLQSSTLHYIPLRSISFHCIHFRSITFHYVALHASACNSIPLPSTTFHCIPSRFCYIPLLSSTLH